MKNGSDDGFSIAFSCSSEYNEHISGKGDVIMAGKKKNVPEQPKKARKQYPGREERIAAADKQIEHLNTLIAERSELIAKTEKTLNERKTALAKSEQLLEKVKEKRERLIASINRVSTAKAAKLTPEERAEKRRAALAKAREVKKAEKAKVTALMSKLQEQGKSIDEVLAALGK